jgi:CRISPR-associated protein Csb1
MTTNVDLNKFDHLLKDDSDASAIVRETHLQNVNGKLCPIAPPTFAAARDEEKDKPSKRKNKSSDYCVSEGEATGEKNCVINTYGAEANRFEVLFKKPRYQKLVPQVTITYKEEKFNLLDTPHRVGDILVKCSTKVGAKAHEALEAFKGGDSTLLGKLFPTSLVHGFWDSRGNYARWGRTISSEIRGLGINVFDIGYSSSPLINWEEALNEAGIEKDQETASALGMDQISMISPKHGRVLAKEVVQSTLIDLVQIRNIGAKDEDTTLKLRRYILGLNLVLFTAVREYRLRVGCTLMLDQDKAENHKNRLAYFDRYEDFPLLHADAISFCAAAKEDFGTVEALEGQFDSKAMVTEYTKDKKSKNEKKVIASAESK